jgi:flagellar motor switch protein FliM
MKLYLTDAVSGALGNLKQEVSGGLLTSVEHQVASDVLSDFVQLARQALDAGSDGAKNVAAVLAAAAFEDTLRRIAKEFAGVIGQDKLENVIGKLKTAGGPGGRRCRP